MKRLNWLLLAVLLASPSIAFADAIIVNPGGGSGGGAPTDATYITQTADGTLSAEQALGALLSGCLSVTTTTGVVASTGADCLGTHNLLSSTHPDTVAGSPTLGDVLIGNASNLWTSLAGDTSDTKKFLRSQSSSSVATAPAWDVLALGDLPSGFSTVTDDRVYIANGSTVDAKAVPDCTDTGGNHLNYTASTNSLSCGTSGGSSLTARDAMRTSGSNLDFDPNDPTVFWLKDEFLGSSVGDKLVGEIGWTSVDAVGTGSTAYGAGSLPNLGVSVLSSGATSGNTQISTLGDPLVSDGTSLLGANASNTFEGHFVFKFNATTFIQGRVGFLAFTSAYSATPENSLTVRFDTVAGDTNFIFECKRASGDSTTMDSTQAADTNFHRVRIRSTSAGTVLFQLYDASGVAQGTEQSCTSTNVPTVDTTAGWVISTATSASRQIARDLFTYKLRGMSR